MHFSQIPGRAAEPKRLVRHGFDNIIPNKVFHIMIEVILIFQTSYNLTREGLIVPKIEDPLKPGNHYFVSDGQFPPPLHLHRQAVAKLLSGLALLYNKPRLTRTILVASGTRDISFRNRGFREGKL